MTDFVFFGTSQFAIPVLETLKQNGLIPALVVSTPDKPSGRGLKPVSSPVKIWAEKNKISVVQQENLKTPAFLQKLADTKCRLVLVASYGKIIPKNILEIPKKGSLNIHPSLLPKWRGADPIRAAILAGDKKTGTTIMLMDEKMDHGPIIAQQELDIKNPELAYLELEKTLAELGGKLLVEVIPKWLAGKITPKEQNHELATFTKKIKKEDGHLNWNESAEIIDRKIRALNPWPGTYSFWNGKRIKILEGFSEPGSATEPGSDCLAGKVLKHNSGLAINCASGIILIKKIQLEGKKSQDAKDFLNGYPNIIGVILN